MNLFSRYQNSLVKENDKNIYYQKKNLKKTSNIRSVEITTRKPKIIKNDYVKENKEKNIQEENLKKKKLIPLDENYEYDEDDEEDEIKEKEKSILKKNKTYSQFSFFKLNKDRANIYKKMNDLRRLQMAYFGGRFLNTKISNGMSTSYGDNVFDEFVNNTLPSMPALSATVPGQYACSPFVYKFVRTNLSRLSNLCFPYGKNLMSQEKTPMLP